MAAEAAIVAPHAPNAVPRSLPWNSCASSASAHENMIAPPTPCPARAMIRNSALGDSAHSSEVKENSDQPDREHQLAAQQVRQRPRRQQQRRERQRVGVDHPLDVREARVQVRGDLRQRDVHDRDVEQQHERRDAHDDQRPPLTFHKSRDATRPGASKLAGGAVRQGAPVKTGRRPGSRRRSSARSRPSTSWR